jgi:CheY-like chemotaxis protein
MGCDFAVPAAVPALTIVVADDDPDIRRLVADILRDEGYRVLAAADGREALALIRRRTPALVLLDLQMPLLTGWDVLDRLRAEDIRTPVVFMTAASRARVEAERHAVAGFLAKPFEVDELLAVVARHAAPAEG